jgi:hypothetical protein
MADVGAATTVASGLANPRGINFAPNGELYVAEAGSGGPGPCIPSAVPVNPPRCYGETGAVTRVDPGVGFTRVITGLPSLAFANGTSEGGPVDVVFLGTSGYVTLGFGGDPALRAQVGGKAWMLGHQLQMTPSGQYRVIADVSAFESANNPDGAVLPGGAPWIDSNPYGSLAQPGRRLVADAGANAVIAVGANGHTSLFAALPPFPAPDGRQAVPTSVIEGADGGIYVGQLTGGPFFKGTASVFRYDSDGSNRTTYAAGFTAVVDIAFDAGGALYVLETASGAPPFPPGIGVGRLLRQCPDGSRTVLLSGLDYPGGVAIGPDGDAYLTNHGVSATAGEVLRLPVEPCN